jgi:hypothetical protein
VASPAVTCPSWARYGREFGAGRWRPDTTWPAVWRPDAGLGVTHELTPSCL